MAIVAVAIFVVAYFLLATELVHRTKVALVGAGLMLLLHISDADKAFFDDHSGVEWNVIFLLFGMMIIVSVLRQTGIFEYVAIWAAKRARGLPYRLMVMLCLLTAFASALLDDDYTPLPPQEWTLGLEVLPAGDAAEPKYVAQSWDGFWRDIDQVEGGQLPSGPAILPAE